MWRRASVKDGAQMSGFHTGKVGELQTSGGAGSWGQILRELLGLSVQVDCLCARLDRSHEKCYSSVYSSLPRTAMAIGIISGVNQWLEEPPSLSLFSI